MTDAKTYAAVFRAAADGIPPYFGMTSSMPIGSAHLEGMRCAFDAIARMFEKMAAAEKAPPDIPYAGTCGSCSFWISHYENGSGSPVNFGVCRNPKGQPSRGNGRQSVNDDESCVFGTTDYVEGLSQ